MSRKPSFARAFITLVTTGLLAAPLMVPAAEAAQCNSVQRGDWVSIYPKAFPHGAPQITNLAVDPLSTDVFFITNGTSVMRTVEFDCNFKEVYVLPDTAALGSSEPTAGDSTIESIEIAEQQRVRVMLAVEQRAGDAVRPRIIKSEDGGNTWATSDVGLPPVGAIDSLVLAPSNPLVGYLGIDVNGGSIDLVYATTDGGATWQLRSNIADAKPQANIEAFVVDPANPESLWARGASSTQAGTDAQTSGLLHSADGGRTFQNVEEFAQTPVGAVDVFHEGSQLRIMAFRRATSDAGVSTDGEVWADVSTPRAVDSVAHGDGADDVVVTSSGRMYAFHPSTFSWIDLGVPNAGVLNVQADRTVFRFTAHTARSLEVFLGDLDEPPPPGVDHIFDVPVIAMPDTPERFPPTLTPEGKTIRIDPGDRKTIRYRLDIARRPLPLNVFFLLDTSDSMGATIEDLARSTANIINELNQEFISLKVGIGAFRAYPDRFPPSPRCDEQLALDQRCEKNYVFQRIHDISIPNAAMSQSLAELESDAGGFYKSHLGALYQLATGDGQDLFPPGPGGHDVPPGLQANFDAKALKVVIHATDEAFGRPVERDSTGSDFGNPQPPDIPSNAEVAAALNARDIMQVGLSIGRAPRRDLEEVARDTGAVAPAEGVDCDGDRAEDLAPGAPLVCDLTRTSLEDDSTNLVPAIVNMLEAVPQSTNVTLEVKGARNVLQRVAPEVHEDVVLQTQSELIYDVTFRCPFGTAGENFRFDLAARARGRVLDDVSARVVCRDVPTTVPPPFTVFTTILPVIPPPPPPPVSQLTSSTQAQGQAQAQAGAATQEEEQPQVAMATAYKEILEKKMAEALEYEMSAYEPRRDPVSPLLVLTAGLIMGAAAYGLTIARERVQVAFQRR